jgi:UDP-N-acetylmuramoylalanine--D-glutamate ligase
MRRVATTFGGLEHRLELVRELDGVKYYNDSFGTTPETAMVAIKAFKEPKIVILGGSDKGSSYDELAEVVAGSGVKKTLLIGKMASNIRQVLDKAGFSDYIDGGDSIEEIVENARANSEAGDVILFSPACASFDMFKNYEDRGNKFKAAVQALS